MRPASSDEINRTRPGLMAVALRHAHIDRKVGAARERYDMIDGKPPAPVLLGQTIDADPPAEAAAVENNRVISERREIDLAGDDVGVERERAAPRRLQPKIDAGQVARGHRSPSQRGAGRGLLHPPFRVEEIDRRETRTAVAREPQFSLPHGLAAAAAILRALPGHAHAAAEIGGREGTRRLHHVGAVQHIEALDRRGADDLGGKPHRHRAGPDDVAHHRLAHLEFFAASELRVFRKRGDGRGERTGQIEEKGKLRLAGNRCARFAPVNFLNPERRVQETAPGTALAWTSVTTGNLAGIDLWLEMSRRGTLTLDTNVVSGEVDLTTLADDT